jgi:hypothetical protein
MQTANTPRAKRLATLIALTLLTTPALSASQSRNSVSAASQDRQTAGVPNVNTSSNGTAAAAARGDNACNSPSAQAAMKKKETALLGARHAEEHERARARKCRVSAGAEQVATIDAALLAAAKEEPASSVGQWSDKIPVPVVGITTALLHTGEVLFWSYDPESYHVVSASNKGVAYLWDPVTRSGQPVDSPENLWCGGQTFLSDGRVYVAGGNLRYPDPSAPAGTDGWQGALSNYTFNPANNQWIAQPTMSVGRWYPTTTQLSDDRVVITSGIDETGSNAITTVVELFTPSPDSNGVGTIEQITPHWPTGFYPYQYLLPDGKMLQAGPAANNSYLLTPDTWTWDMYPQLLASHYAYGNGISFTDVSGATPKQVIMLAGGTRGGEAGTEATNENEYMDGFNPSMGWRNFPEWLQPRRNSGTVILADGTLFTVGGNNASAIQPYDNPLFHAEIYNKLPTDLTGAWVKMMPNTIQAAYHSSVILLPDATVLLTADDMGPASHNHVQVYSPPYLFKGTRPKITAAPEAVGRGHMIEIGTDTPNIASAMLVAPSATTHANDMHQRAIKLKTHSHGRHLKVSIPSEAGIVPPGYYMLFILNGDGVPSVAKFIRVT